MKKIKEELEMLSAMAPIVLPLIAVMVLFMVVAIPSLKKVDVTVISCEAQESKTVDCGSGIRTYSMATGNLMGVAFGSSMRHNDADYDAIVEFEGQKYEIVLESEFEPGETVEVHPDRLKEID